MNSYLDVLFSGLSKGTHGAVGVDFRPEEKKAVKSNPLQATTKRMPREKAEKSDRKKKHKKQMAKASRVRNRR